MTSIDFIMRTFDVWLASELFSFDITASELAISFGVMKDGVYLMPIGRPEVKTTLPLLLAVHSMLQFLNYLPSFSHLLTSDYPLFLPSAQSSLCLDLCNMG